MKLEPEGSPFSALNEVGAPGAGGKPEALALDSAGNLYFGDKTFPYRIKRFDPAGEQTSQFGAGQLTGSPRGNALALDEATGSLFVAGGLGGAVQRLSLPPEGPLVEDQSATGLSSTAVTLQADLNPEGHPTTYRFQWGEGTSFDRETEEKSLPGSEYETEAVEAAELQHLLPETEYSFRLEATNHCRESEPSHECVVHGEAVHFTTAPAIRVDAQWVSTISAAEATLRAEMNPLGPSAEWWIEYGPGETLGTATAELPLGEGFGDIEVSRTLTGLAPATVYSYRFAAKDVREVEEGGEIVAKSFVSHGPTRTFRTSVTALGFGLPDGRAWEQVTPLHKGLGRVGAFAGGITQAAEDGSALAYTTFNPVGEGVEGNRTLDALSSLARRGGPGQWSSQALGPPEETASPGLLAGGELRVFSADLCRAAAEPYGQRAKSSTLLSQWSTERTPFLRESCGATPVWTPLAVGCPAPPEPCPALVAEHANVPAGTEFGGEEEGQLDSNRMPVAVKGADADLAHVVVRSQGDSARRECR